MTLPIRTTLEDADKVCAYLNNKPTGASQAEARAVLDKKVLDGRKLSALRSWGLIEDDGNKMKATERGRMVARNKGAQRAEALSQAIASLEPYRAIIERAVHREEGSITATEVASHWYEHFRDSSSSNERILNDQAVCFFQLAEGADLGQIKIGRRGQPTRFEFNLENANAFVQGEVLEPTGEQKAALSDESKTGYQTNHLEHDEAEANQAFDGHLQNTEETAAPKAPKAGNRVFITHGKNKKILDQVKQIVEYGKFTPVVAQENETVAKSLTGKVMDDMRSCSAAVIHVGSDDRLFDSEGNEKPQINQNVLIEIGAAMALYGRNFILLVEDGISLPSNLQGLYECRYSGDELNMPATMKLLKAFNDFQ